MVSGALLNGDRQIASHPGSPCRRPGGVLGSALIVDKTSQSRPA